MKLLFTLTYYRPHWTGLTRYAARLAEGLANRGHDVEVLCTQHTNELAIQETIRNVKVHRSPVMLRVSRTQIAPSFLIQFQHLVKSADRIIVYLPLAEIAAIATLTKRTSKPLYVIHNGDLLLPSGSLNTAIMKLYQQLSTYALNRAEKIIIQTQDYAQQSNVLKSHQQKWVVIPPIVTIEKPGVAEWKWIRSKINSNHKIVGFAGRFVEEKGVEYLLQSIPFVLKKHANTLFVFSGETKITYEHYWKKIEPLINKYKNRIILLGLIGDEKKLAAFYEMLDVFVLPSKSDCFPSVQVEAMLHGVPVVCTNIPGARWVIQKTRMGVLVESENPRAIADGISEVLTNRRKYAHHAEKVKKVFNHHQTMIKYEKLFLKAD